MAIKPWLELARISNLPTAWTNVLAGWLLAGGEIKDARVLWLLLGASLMYSAGMILNDAADAKCDREHRKERPIPRGSVTQSAAWMVGIAGLLLGAVACVFGGGANANLTLLLLLAILAYDLYHKPWPGSVIVMGACRVLLYLVAASPILTSMHLWVGGYTVTLLFNDSLIPIGVFRFAASPLAFPSGCPLYAALALGCYIVGVTLIARWEGKGQATGARRIFAIAMLLTPALLATLAAFISFELFLIRYFLFLVVFVSLVAMAVRLMRQGGAAIGRAVGILLAGIAVVDGLAVASVSFSLACGFVALAPLLRLWQRKIAAT